jgi:hypothetical protein
MTSKAPVHGILRDARVIREPVGAGQGYWAGAPGVFHAVDERAFYLTYRIRRPRGVAPDRGGEARIARSTDLQHFDDIWTVNKDAYGSASIERSALRRGRDGIWRYFTSFVDPADGRWCVAVLKHADPARFDPASARKVLTAGSLDLQGVKDPWIFEDGGINYMLLSVAVPTPRTRDESHATLDIFNTGDCVSATGLARSGDLDEWEWLGVVFAPSAGAWDAYCRRINSVVAGQNALIAFYDGSASHLENYEERTGLAISHDGRSWQTASPSAAVLTSPHATGSLRYLDAVVTDRAAWAFYECAREDGAHDLRLARLDLEHLHRAMPPDTIPRSVR